MTPLFLLLFLPCKATVYRKQHQSLNYNVVTRSYRNLYLWITSGVLGKIGVRGKLVYAKTNKVPGEAGISSFVRHKIIIYNLI